MELSTYVGRLGRDLAAAAAVGGPDVARAADLLAGALEPAVRLALQDALAAAAEELTAALGGPVIEVRLRRGEPDFAVVVGSADSAEPEGADEGGTARITLRLPESLKAQVERAAAAERASVNAWLVRAVRDALAPPARAGRPGPSRFTGLARA